MAIPDGFDWEAEGRRLGDRLDALNAIVVLGLDPASTARVALGIARAQAPKRRVALGDLLGDAEPLQALVSHEDPHGLVDSFVYGVSLNRVGLRVPGEGELYLLPTGTEAPNYDEILPSPRWRRLAAGFREVGALLVLVAPADAAHVEQLVGMTDGAVLVGEGVPRNLPIAQVISYVQPVRPRVGQVAESSSPAPERKRRWSTGRLVALGAALVILGALVGAGLWLSGSPFGSGRRPAWMTRRDTGVANGPAPIASARTSDSAATDSAAGTVGSAPAPVNPADSDSAAAFAVALTNANTQDGAILNLQENGRSAPAATFAPILIAGVPWYRVLVGAYPDSASADSLRGVLRAIGLLDSRSGSVVRTPFAFLLDSSVAADSVSAVLARYPQSLPVYPLFKSDGSARVYAGAFENPAQAAMYADSLRAAGFTPVLAYRIGRVH